jgi:hypothetical protein
MDELTTEREDMDKSGSVQVITRSVLLCEIDDPRRFAIPPDMHIYLVDRPCDTVKYKYYFFEIYDSGCLQIMSTFDAVFTQYNNDIKKIKNGFFAQVGFGGLMEFNGCRAQTGIIAIFETQSKTNGRYGAVAQECQQFLMQHGVNPENALLVPIDESAKVFENAYAQIFDLSLSSGVGKAFGAVPHTKYLHKLMGKDEDEKAFLKLCDLFKDKKEHEIAQIVRVMAQSNKADADARNAMKWLLKKGNSMVKVIQDIKTMNEWTHTITNAFLRTNRGRVVSKLARWLFEELRASGLQMNIGAEGVWEHIKKLMFSSTDTRKVLTNSFVSPSHYYNLFCSLMIFGENDKRGRQRHLLISGPYMTGKTMLAIANTRLLDGLALQLDNQTQATRGFMTASMDASKHGVVVLEDMSSKALVLNDNYLRPFIDGVKTVSRGFQQKPKPCSWGPIITTTNCPLLDAVDTPMPECFEQAKKLFPQSLDYYHEGSASTKSLAALDVFNKRYTPLRMDQSLENLGTHYVKEITESDYLAFIFTMQFPDCNALYDGVKEVMWCPCRGKTFTEHHYLCRSMLRLCADSSCYLNVHGENVSFNRVSKSNISLFLKWKDAPALLDSMMALYKIPAQDLPRDSEQVALAKTLDDFVSHVWKPLTAFSAICCGCDEVRDTDDDDFSLDWVRSIPELSKCMEATEYNRESITNEFSTTPTPYDHPVRSMLLSTFADYTGDSFTQKDVECLRALGRGKCIAMIKESARDITWRAINDRRMWQFNIPPPPIRAALRLTKRSLASSPWDASIVSELYDTLMCDDVAEPASEQQASCSSFKEHA